MRVWDLSIWRLTSVCLSRTSGLSREQRGLGRLKLAQSPRHIWLGHHFQGQKVKDVADVLNSQHAGTGATWRINSKILSTCRGAEAYCVATRTACYSCEVRWDDFVCSCTPYTCRLSCKVAVLLCKAFVENIFCTFCMLVYITVVFTGFPWFWRDCFMPWKSANPDKKFEQIYKEHITYMKVTDTSYNVLIYRKYFDENPFSSFNSWEKVMQQLSCICYLL